MSDAENPTYHADGLAPNRGLDGCLLCHVEKLIPDPDTRALAFMSVADMAQRAGDSWQSYSNCCRRHAMQSLKAISQMNGIFVDLLRTAKGAGPEDLEAADHLQAFMTRQIARLEATIIDRYDRRTK